MEQNDAEVNQNSKMRSGNSEQQKDVTELRSKISLSNFQMLELTHNDQKFTDRIFQLNDKGISSIESGAYEQALLYLGQAQKLLQYAASCGRALDREIILKILKNEAVVYHKIWDLDRSISYIQAIIFNLRTFLNGKENIDVVLKLQEIGQKIQDSSFQQDFLDDFIETHYEKLKLIIQKKFQLSLFYLQYSTLNSQNQDHMAALSESRQAFAQYQQTFGFCTILMKIKKTLRKQHKSQALSLVLLEQVMRIIQPNVQSFGTINKKIQEIQKVFDQKSHAPSSFNFILQKYSSLQKKQPKYKNFSLTSVMELHPKFFGQKILDQQSKLAYDEYFFQQIQNTEILIERILQFSVVLFTISNQIRQTQHQSRAHQNNEHFQPNQQQSANNKKISQLYYISALHISIQIVQELTQFSRYIFKHYFQIYSNQKIKASNQSMSKMDSLKEKYKKFIPMEIDKDFTDSLDDQPCANNISQYSINIKVSQAASKDNKENKLQKLFKQNNKTSPDITTAAPPRLNIDLSQIQSLQYGGSKTFKQNNQHSYNNLPPEQVIEEEYDAKQTKKFQNLNVKKIKTVPNLSDVSSNRQSQSISRQISPQKSNYSKQTNREEKPISSRLKQKSSKKQEQKPKIKLLNHNSQKSKPQIKKFISPKNINRKSHQNNNQAQSKKKPFLPQKKIFSDKKVLDQNDKTSSQNKKKLVFKDKKKKKDEITPQPSKRKTQEYFQTQKQKQKDNQEEKKVNRISKLRKAKSFQQVIYPYEDIKPIMYASKDISNTYNHIFHKPISKEKLKTIAQNTKKTKSSQNLKFTVKTARKPVKVQAKPQPVSKALLETNKDSVLKKKKTSNLSIKQPPTINSSIAPTKNAVRMSSLSNLMNSANDRQALKKMKSSKSLHQSNYQYSSGYLLKGLQVNASQQRTKAGSMAMTTSLRKKV